jgi:hypothetical protein
MKFKDVAGKQFGRLIAIRRIERGRRKGRWLCKCSCGKQITVPVNRLNSSETRSCGCYRVSPEQLALKRKKALIHGKVRTPVYRAYYQARGACQNPAHKDYPRCGAVGIKFEFANFREFFDAIGEKPGPEFWLRRLDPADNFKRSNLAWIPIKHPGRWVGYRRKRQKQAHLLSFAQGKSSLGSSLQSTP